jgi:hypothetical protein
LNFCEEIDWILKRRIAHFFGSIRRSRDHNHTTRPNPTANHNVAKRINIVAAAAVSLDKSRIKTNMPAIEASAAPKPPGKAVTAPITVEKASTKTATDNVVHPGATPNPIRIKYIPMPSPSQDTVPIPTAVRMALGRKRV